RLTMQNIYCLLLIFAFTCGPSHLRSQSGADAVRLYRLFALRDSFELANRRTDGFAGVTEAGMLGRAAFYRALQSEARQIAIARLNAQDKINHQIFAFILADEISAVDFQMYLIPFNAEGGFYNQAGGAFRGQMRNREDVGRVLARLSSYPQYLDDHIRLMKLGMERGIVAPRSVAGNYRALIAPFSSPDPAKNALWKSLQAMPAQLPSSVRDSLLNIGRQVIFERIVPAYAAFDKFMQEDYLPVCRERPGISEVPGGREYYRNRIAHYTTLEMSPEEVFSAGEREVARIRAEMDTVMRQAGFSGTLAEFFDFLRTDPQFYASTPRRLLQEAAYWAKKIDGRLPAYFDPLPRLSYGVEPVPEAIAPNYTGGRYSPGSAANHRAGNYWVNTYKLESRPLYVLPALTLHEAVPGHHLQMALAEEQGTGPAFRRNYYISAFGEGWALYAEYLGKEMGIYETPYEDFGRLTYEMWRACRLVIDVGIHYMGWSQQQALDYLSANAALSLHECETEIERYIGWPGQAVSYKIGEITIRRLRKSAEAALGPKFNIRDFHRVILENGSVPLFILEQEVEKYIADKSTVHPGR
ncbi:MAG: hypothetical protein RL386_2004, partial [Bacteroidota bacterium]